MELNQNFGVISVCLSGQNRSWKNIYSGTINVYFYLLSERNDAFSDTFPSIWFRINVHVEFSSIGDWNIF